MNIIIAYDISDERRLIKVAKISEDYGTRVQKSIFELEVTARAFREMIQRIEDVIDPATDGVKYFLLCGNCVGKVEVIGRGIYVDPDAEYSVC